MRMRVAQLWHWIYFRGRRRLLLRCTMSPKSMRGQLASAFSLAPARGRRGAGLAGRHAQMAAALPADGGRGAGRDRMRLYPRGGPRHALRLLPGRLHAQLQLLPHRHAAPGAQPHDRRDRRPGHGGAPAAGDFPGLERPTDGLGPRAKAPRRHQHRLHGHGRAALQYRERRRRSRSWPTARVSAFPSAASPSRPPASCRRSSGSAPKLADAGDLPARGERRAARRARAAQQEISDRRAARRLQGLSRRLATRGASPSNM